MGGWISPQLKLELGLGLSLPIHADNILTILCRYLNDTDICLLTTTKLTFLNALLQDVSANFWVTSVNTFLTTITIDYVVPCL